MDRSEKEIAAVLFEALDEAAQSVFYVIQDGRFVYGNKNGCRITGLDSAKDVNGKPALTYVHPDDKPLLVRMSRRAMRGERIEPFEWRLHTVDGGIVWVMGLLMPIAFQGRPALLGNYIDITPVQQTRSELKRTTAKLEELAIDLESARQEERARIAWELQENLGQTLAALREQVAGAPEDAAAGGEDRQRLVHRIDSALDTVARISAHMVPEDPSRHDLADALRQYAREFKDRTGTVLKVVAGSGARHLTGRQSRTVFRLIEAMVAALAPLGRFSTIEVRLERQDPQTIVDLSASAAELQTDVDPDDLPGPLVRLSDRLGERRGRLSVHRRGQRIVLGAACDLTADAGGETRILFAGESPILMEGLRRMLGGLPEVVVCGLAETFLDLSEKIRVPDIDMALVETLILGGRATDNLEKLKEAAPHLPILVFHAAGEDDDFAVRLLRRGAAGYLSRSSSANELIAAVHKVAGGRKHISNRLAEKLAFEVDLTRPKSFHHLLSDRERQVMFMIAEGKAMKEIAAELHLSYKTIATYRNRIFEKMSMTTNAEIVRHVVSKGLI